MIHVHEEVIMIRNPVVISVQTQRMHTNRDIIPFNPTLSTQEIIALSETYWDQIIHTLSEVDQRPVGVMIAGEPITCSVLVPQFQRAGVTCYSATTLRESSEESLGVKTSTYTFVRFREWPEA